MSDVFLRTLQTSPPLNPSSRTFLTNTNTWRLPARALAQTHSQLLLPNSAFRGQKIALTPRSSRGCGSQRGSSDQFLFTRTETRGGAAPDSLAGSLPFIFNCVLSHELAFSPNL